MLFAGEQEDSLLTQIIAKKIKDLQVIWELGKKPKLPKKITH
jgi:hypothetical protein